MGGDASIAINVTLSGLAIVFGTLIGLVFVIWALGKIMDLTRGIGKKPAVKAAAPAPVATPAPAVPAPVSAPAVPAAPAAVAEDDEIIAVIAAAVSDMYQGTGKTPVIRAVYPVYPGARPIWSAAGLVQNTRAF